MNLEEDTLLQLDRVTKAFQIPSLMFHFFFLHSNLSWCCAMKLIHKGLNIEQLLNFSLLHNDYVIWLNNVHRVKSEKNLCTKNSLLESDVIQVHYEPK